MNINYSDEFFFISYEKQNFKNFSALSWNFSYSPARDF